MTLLPGLALMADVSAKLLLVRDTIMCSLPTRETFLLLDRIYLERKMRS